MNAIRNLETLDCKDTGCQKIDSVIYLRTSAMKVGEKRRRDARDEPTSDQTRWDAREEEAEPEPHVFFFFFFFNFIC